MIHPQYIFFSLAAMIFFPVLFHIVTFGKKIEFMSIVTSILISEFILCSFLEIFSLFYFNAEIILVVTLIAILVSGYLLRYRMKIPPKNMKKEYMLLAVLFVFVLFIVKNRFPPFWPDSFSTYLHYGRTIVENGELPRYDLSNIRYVFAYPPLLYTKIALLFGMFNNFFDTTTVGIPIFYTMLTFFVLIYWSKEYSNKEETKYFVLISFVMSIGIVHTTMLLQEGPLIFFSTLSFYLLYRYLKKKEEFTLTLLFISCCLCMLTKYSGGVIALLIVLLLLYKRYATKTMYRLPLFIPAAFWYLKNLVYYGNPFPPLLSGLFKGEIYEIVRFNMAWTIPTNIEDLTIFSVTLRFFVLFPALIFVVVYFIRNRKDLFANFVLFSFVTYFFIFLSAFGHFHVRYFASFYGVFALFAGIEISKLWNKIFKEKEIMTQFLFLIALIFVIFGAATESGEPIPSELEMDSLNPLYIETPGKKWPNEFDIIHRGVRDTVVVGEYNGVLSWYGENTVMPFKWRNFKAKIKKGLPLHESSTYYYTMFTDISAQYVYDSPEKGRYEEIFATIAHDAERFELVFSSDGHRVWKIKEKK